MMLQSFGCFFSAEDAEPEPTWSCPPCSVLEVRPSALMSRRPGAPAAVSGREGAAGSRSSFLLTEGLSGTCSPGGKCFPVLSSAFVKMTTKDLTVLL